MGAWIEIRYCESLKLSFESHPTMGAWIEICPLYGVSIFNKSHPTMGAWIEIMTITMSTNGAVTSHPTMGAWIEITITRMAKTVLKVAPHDGCVD